MRKSLIPGLVAIVSMGLWATSALAVVTNRYDFESTSGFVTEVGWTHVDITTAYTTNSAGFHLGGVSTFLGAFDRLASTQSPTNVTRDEIIGDASIFPTNVPVIVFRDIVPASATNVSFTIYRSDPIDAFQPRFTTKVSFNGGSQVTVDTGINAFGTYFTPITGNLALQPVVTNTVLDFYFYMNSGVNGANLRLNGIQTVFTIPEPTTLALVAVPLSVLAVIRRRRPSGT